MTKPNDRVQCFVRIRPSAHFAHDNIEILNYSEEDNKNKLIQLKNDRDYKTNFTRFGGKFSFFT